MVRYRLGRHGDVNAAATIGYGADQGTAETSIGRGATVRSGVVIYFDVKVGKDFAAGHNALIRESTAIGDHVAVGPNTVIDSGVTIGSKVSLQAGVYVPPGTVIGDHVAVGPNAVLGNNRHPARREFNGPTIEDGVFIGANATIRLGITVEEGSVVAAGAVVTKDVPPRTLAVGAPASHRQLPEELRGVNVSI